MRREGYTRKSKQHEFFWVRDEEDEGDFKKIIFNMWFIGSGRDE